MNPKCTRNYTMRKVLRFFFNWLLFMGFDSLTKFIIFMGGCVICTGYVIPQSKQKDCLWSL